MKNDKINGYSPAKGYLLEKLKSIGRFHDPDGFNDFDIEFHRSSDTNHITNNLKDPVGLSPKERAQQHPASTNALIEAARRRLQDMSRGYSYSPRKAGESDGELSSGHKSAASRGPNVEPKPLSTAAQPSLDAQAAASDGDPTEDAEGASSPSVPLAGDSDGDANDSGDGGSKVHGSSDARGTGTPSRLSEWLITPRSLYGRRVQYCFLEYDPLLDSCNMDMTDWVRIVTDIEKFYYTFDAFIILHGTDTMSYTAGALSFMLQNLGKSVIVTGSQVPIAEVRNDGIENFLGALTIAGHFVVPEVTLYFNNKLFRGNRCVKIDAMDFDA
ncbi:hypothetical protein GGF43_006953, partial [Coemansia sp. RSA 2618]